MGWVRTRLTGLLLAVAMVAAAALPLAALAQDPGATTTPAPGEPTPTPTASPSPTPEPTDPEAEEKARQDARDRKRKVVRRIYRDFERDGRISACDHSRKALRIAKRSIEDSYDEDFPDFRDAVQAAIDRHKKGKCEPLPEDLPEPVPTPTPSPASGTLDESATPAPAPPPPPPPPAAAPAPSPESGALPGLGGDDSGGAFAPPPDEGAIPEGTPAPPQATPAPTAPAGPPRLIVTRSANDANLAVPGTMLAIALAGLLIAAGTAVAGKRSGRFAGVGHAWREAAWRTSGTWSDFTDWLRSGR
jgi:hypothetical protein